MNTYIEPVSDLAEIMLLLVALAQKRTHSRFKLSLHFLAVNIFPSKQCGHWFALNV